MEDLIDWLSSFAKESRRSGKERSTDKPSWVDERPTEGEAGKDFAKRMMDKKYGKGNWEDERGDEFRKFKKWADRSR